MSGPVTIAALSGLAGLVALDATAALQVMVSQPIVAGALAGALCGDVVTGTLVGAMLQLVWSGALPVGAAGFPDAPVGTVTGVGLAVMLAGSGCDPAWRVAMGLAVALVVGAAGQRVVGRLRRWNVRLSDLAAVAAKEGDPSGVNRAVAAGLALRFLAGAALAAVALSASLAALRAVRFPAVRGPFPGLIWAAPLAAALVAHRTRAGAERVLMAAGFVAGVVMIMATG